MIRKQIAKTKLVISILFVNTIDTIGNQCRAVDLLCFEEGLTTEFPLMKCFQIIVIEVVEIAVLHFLYIGLTVCNYHYWK